MPIIYTIGHSVHPIAVFLEMLRAHGIERLVDVRTAPGSRRHPQFAKAALAESLRAVGIEYEHMGGLGGWRKPRPDSANTAWRSAGFRGYADYMATEEFEGHLATLIERAERQRTATMCAEATPYRCHRSLISDALTARGVQVLHIRSAARSEPHRLTSFAVVEGTKVRYPGQGELGSLSADGGTDSRVGPEL